MDRAELALATSLRTLGQMQASIANNLSNLNSTSYKRRIGYLDDFEHALHHASSTQLPSIVPSYREVADVGQGDFRTTNDANNLALIGDGYFRVRDSKGKEYYTREGSIARAPDGTLLTRNGLELLDITGEPITMPEIGAFKITTQGRVIDEANGEERGRLGVWNFADPQALIPHGASLYRAPTSLKAQPDARTQIRQGGLENSNVDGVKELVAMITVQRHHGAVAKALSTVESMHDQLLQLARG